MRETGFELPAASEVMAGDIRTMPGLPKEPAALSIDVTPDGQIVGLR